MVRYKVDFRAFSIFYLGDTALYTLLSGSEHMEKTKRNHKQYKTNIQYVKRKHPRAAVEGFVADIADGNFVLEGNVADISSGGFKMSNLPYNFSATSRSYTTVISGDGKHYRMVVVPCWKMENGIFLDVGFKIVQAPWEWSELILQAVPSSGDESAFQA